ncbi:MAG: type II toxin-antitoxin system VapC family toxin [Endozoicomonas sp.]
MSKFILDCSIAAAWCFEDEASDTTDNLLERVRDHGAVVPSLWLLEITNVLLQAERRGRITASDATTRLELLHLLPISIEHSTQAETFNNVITLARAESLTSYDAAYLELAIRLNLPLATLDKKLIQAAKNSNIEILPQ